MGRTAPRDRRQRLREGPTHPTLTAAVLMIAVVAFIVLVSALGVLGR